MDGKQRTLCGLKTQQLEAAQVASEALGVTVAKLRLPARANARGPHSRDPAARDPEARGPEEHSGPLTSYYHHVSWHQGKRAWQGEVDGTWLSPFPTMVKAAEAVAKHLGIPVENLKKPKQDKLKPAVALRRFRVLCPLASKLFPGDLESAMEERRLALDMFQAEPALEMLSVWGKYRPWRRALHAAWKQLQRPGAKSGARCPATVEARAAFCHEVLHAATRAVSGDTMEVWVQNCGRNVNHHSGYLPMLSYLLCLQHCKEEEGPRGRGSGRSKASSHSRDRSRGPEVFYLGKLLTPYQWRVDAREEALRKIELVVQASDIFASALQSPPRTCKQWVESFKQVEANALPLRAPGMVKGDGNMMGWTFRSWAIPRMRVAKITRLRGAADVTLEEFATSFPDQRGWFQTWPTIHRNNYYNNLRKRSGAQPSGAKKSGAEQSGAKLPGAYCPLTLPQLFEMINFPGPPEEASMTQCLLSDHQLDAHPDVYYGHILGQLSEVSTAYRKQHNIWPHIAVALDMVQNTGHPDGPPAKRARC